MDGAMKSSKGRGSHLRMHNILQQSLYAQHSTSPYVHNIHAHGTHVCITLSKYIIYRHGQKKIIR